MTCPEFDRCPAKHYVDADLMHRQAQADIYLGDDGEASKAMQQKARLTDLLNNPRVTDAARKAWLHQKIAEQDEVLRQASQLEANPQPAFDLTRLETACFDGDYDARANGEGSACYRFCGSLALNEDERNYFKMVAREEE